MNESTELPTINRDILKSPSLGLLPCPFCGGEAQIDIAFNGVDEVVVMCGDCHATGSTIEAGYSEYPDVSVVVATAEAIAAWNMRRPTPQP